MGIRKKTINYEVKSYMIYCLITALVLNAFTVIVPQYVLSYLSIFIELIPPIIGFIFVYNVWRSFSEERLYLHIIPVSKGKIHLDMFLNFLLVYTLVWLIKIIFIFIKLDYYYIASNTDIYGVFLGWFVTYASSLIIFIFFNSIILLSKIYGTKRVIITTAITLTILSNMAPDFSDKFVYKYNSSIMVSDIDTIREAKRIEEREEEIMENSDGTVNIVWGTYPFENSVDYKSILFNGPIILILFFYTLKNINKVNISYEINIKERRSLYEKRWYDKWI